MKEKLTNNIKQNIMIGRIYSEAVYSGVYNNIVLMACEK